MEYVLMVRTEDVKEKFSDVENESGTKYMFVSKDLEKYVDSIAKAHIFIDLPSNEDLECGLISEMIVPYNIAKSISMEDKRGDKKEDEVRISMDEIADKFGVDVSKLVIVK